MHAKLWVVVVAGVACGCGGATFTGPSDGGTEGGSGSGSGSSGGGSSGSGSGGSGSGSSSGSSSSGGSSGSSSGGTTPTCPPSAPNGGTACPVAGMECEYGDNPNPACNDIETCLPSGTWSEPAPGPACPAGTCPATYAEVPQGKACSQQELDCSYPQGQCNCSNTPVASPSPVWQCTTPAQGCPEPRPDIGSACSQPDLACDYGSCTGGVEVQCTDGSWQVVETPCPV